MILFLLWFPLSVFQCTACLLVLLPTANTSNDCQTIIHLLLLPQPTLSTSTLLACNYGVMFPSVPPASDPQAHSSSSGVRAIFVCSLRTIRGAQYCNYRALAEENRERRVQEEEEEKWPLDDFAKARPALRFIWGRTGGGGRKT